MWSVFRSLFGKKLEDGRKILPAGDCALVVEFGNEINEALNRKVQCLNEKVAAAHVKGIVETVPTFRSLMVTYDPSEISFEQLKKELSGISVEESAGQETPHHVVEIPVCYGGSYGEDLKDVAAHAGLTEEEVITPSFFCRLQYLYVGIPSWISVSGRTGSEVIYPAS